ncbi:MAG: GldG family protein [Mastigocoleus sp.]
MTISSKIKPWKYLFWLGPFLIAAGLTVGVISETWGIIPLILVASGTFIASGWLALQSRQSNWWGKRSTQAGANAIVATISLITILVLVNFLGSRYNWRADLTEERLYTLAPQTQELVKSLTTPVRLLIFDVTENPVDQDLLENYKRQNPNFQFEYIDPNRPGLPQKFGVRDRGEVYIESGDRRQLVQVVNQQQRLSEVKLTNSLQQITSTTTAKIYFLQGHGEHPLTQGENSISQAVQALKDKNFVPQPLNLANQTSVPEDADVVAIAGPENALFDTEVQALQKYLDNGGNLLLLLEPDTDPNLNNLLSQWGIELDNRLAVEIPGSPQFGPAVPIVQEYGKHPITRYFGNNFSVYRLARPILTKETPGIQTSPLLKTKPFPNSWAESDRESEELEFNEAPKEDNNSQEDQKSPVLGDTKGPLTLGVALSKKVSVKKPLPTPTPTPTTSPTPNPTPTKEAAKPEKTPEEDSGESRMVVIGDSDFVTNSFFQFQLNGDVFLNSVTWLSQQDDKQPLSIRPKEPTNRRLNLATVQYQLIGWTSIIILPLIAFSSAAFLWWRRR